MKPNTPVVRSVQTLLVVLVGVLFGTDAPAAAAPPDDDFHHVARFELEWVQPLPTLPAIERFLLTEVDLARTGRGFVAPDEGGTPVRIAIGETQPGRGERVRIRPRTFDAAFSSAAIRTIARALELRGERDEGLRVVAGPSERDIEPVTGDDLRPGARGILRMRIGYDGPFLPVSRFRLAYAGDRQRGLPAPADVLAGATVTLVPTRDGFVSWRPGRDARTYTVAQLSAAGRSAQDAQQYSAGAIQMILEAVRNELTRGAGLMSVFVQPADGQLGAGPTDLRGGRTELDLAVFIGTVRDVRTLASGDRFPPERRENLPEHARIRDNSPVQPVGNGGAGSALLRREALDDFIYLMSRHPGRRVDAAVAPSGDVLGVSLDYIVTENDPLTVYGQVSNTGTQQTNSVRYRTGLFHNQLTGNDDILSLEFVTADLDETNAVVGSYEARVGDNDRLRWRAYGTWSEFAASEVGFANLRFDGSSWRAGGEVIWNVHQKGQRFVDVVAGLRYQHEETRNAIVFTEGDEDFLIPHFGLRLQDSDETSATDLSGTFEFHLNELNDVDRAQLNGLGRFAPDKDWILFRWDAAHTFYLEPLLNRAAWADPSTPESSTLAHEVALRFRGQYAFENRLIPQLEQVAGGLYTVRGYDESVAVGDTVLLATAEYRFHVPRAFGTGQPVEGFLGMQKPFRVVPQYPYGQADWDLVLRGFVDVGRTIVSEPFSFEKDRTLIGAGIGAQLIFRRNLDVRVDWGFALEEIENVTNSGSNRVHLVATILF